MSGFPDEFVGVWIPELVQATTRAAVDLSTCGSASFHAISRSVLSLYERTCRTMLLTNLKATAAALVLGAVAAGAIVSAQPPGGGRAGTSGRATKEISVDPNRHCIVNVYSTDEGVDQDFLRNFATANVLPGIKRIRGIGGATILGSRQSGVRARLNPDRMRAYAVSDHDVVRAMQEEDTINWPGRIGGPEPAPQPFADVLTWVGRPDKPEPYENIILKANPDGEILRLKDVAKVESGSFYNVGSDIDGHPSAAIVLKQAPGSNTAVVIEEVKKTLERSKEESFPPGMNFEVTPVFGVSKDPGMIYAVIQTRPGSALEYIQAKCRELQAIARGIEGVASVSSLAGYEVLTERRGSNAGTCLIILKDSSRRKLTSRQIIRMLEEKYRWISDVKLEFFEPPVVPGSGAAGATRSAQPGPAAGGRGRRSLRRRRHGRRAPLRSGETRK